jgi:hypothetical protein
MGIVRSSTAAIAPVHRSMVVLPVPFTPAKMALPPTGLRLTSRARVASLPPHFLEQLFRAISRRQGTLIFEFVQFRPFVPHLPAEIKK